VRFPEDDDLLAEVLALFAAASALVGAGWLALPGFQVVRSVGSWTTTDPALEPVDPWDWRRARSRAAATGVLPRRRRPRGRPPIGLEKFREARRRARETTGGPDA
jgi:hypothetical protein